MSSSASYSRQSDNEVDSSYEGDFVARGLPTRNRIEIPLRSSTESYPQNKNGTQNKFIVLCLGASLSCQFNEPTDVGGKNLAQAVAIAKAWVRKKQLVRNPRERVTETRIT
jgi:hypothetical protein